MADAGLLERSPEIDDGSSKARGLPDRPKLRLLLLLGAVLLVIIAAVVVLG